MIALLQRVNSAKVCINQQSYSAINNGLLVLLGIDKNDRLVDIHYLIDKIINLRIFNDNKQKMNLSILDIKGEILVVSQFILLANIKKGRRPSFIDSAEPKIAEKLYNMFVDKLNKVDLIIESGKFGAIMDIQLINNGPATFILNSKI